MKLLYNGKTKLSVQEILKPLEAWESNPKCLRSINYQYLKKQKAKGKH